MAIFRTIQMSFWTDSGIIDEYTPEDKLFYLYVLTNPHTNLCGCYEICMRQMMSEIGLPEKKIKELITKAQEVHRSVCYSPETKELLVLRWSKYNWTSSEKFRKPLLREIQNVKNNEFKAFLMNLYDGNDTVSIPYLYRTDTVSIPYVYGTDTTDTDIYIDIIKRVVNYLNTKCNTHYKENNKNTVKYIKARLGEGFTEQDFYDVIDKKAEEWIGTSYEQYLRPETLFSQSKFEGYLNQRTGNSNNSKKAMEDWINGES